MHIKQALLLFLLSHSILCVEHLYRGVHSQRRDAEKCQDKGDMASPPSLAFSLLVLSLSPFFSLPFPIHSPSPSPFILSSTLWGASFAPSSFGCVSRAGEMRRSSAVLWIVKHNRRWGFARRELKFCHRWSKIRCVCLWGEGFKMKWNVFLIEELLSWKESFQK